MNFNHQLAFKLINYTSFDHYKNIKLNTGFNETWIRITYFKNTVFLELNNNIKHLCNQTYKFTDITIEHHLTIKTILPNLNK